MPRMGAFSGNRVVAPQRAVLMAPAVERRGAVQVVAAEQQKKKRTDSAVKRAQLAEERHMRNKSRKSAIATYTKKVKLCISSHIGNLDCSGGGCGCGKCCGGVVRSIPLL